MHHSKHWDKQAPTYTNEIFNVYANDYHGRLKAMIQRYANPKGHAVDFGCGTGNGFALMAPLFKHIMAFDVSAGLLKQAAARGYNNISVNKLDLTDSKAPIPYTDFGVCCNVAISHDIKMDYAIIKNVLRAINKKGTVIFVLPSLESGCLTTWNLTQWHKKEKTTVAEIPDAEIENINLSIDELRNGVCRIDNRPTKHYSLHELFGMFHSGNFEIVSVEKLEYPWQSEFATPPKWMQAPYPWDWAVEVRRWK